jgi:hypothetical protein
MARRRPRISLLLSLALCWASAATAAADERAARIDRIRSSARAGRHDEVEAQARAVLNTLPPDDRPDAWSIDFNPTFAPGLTLPLFLQERASFSVTMVEHE